MSDGIVEGALGHVATGDMRQRNTHHQSRLCCRQSLEAVTEQHHHVGLQPRENIGKTACRKSHGLGHANAAVARQQHFHLGVDSIAVTLDLAIGSAKFGRQMHAGCGQLQSESGIGHKCRHDRLQ